ncbi:MAG TPA: YkgJ family cysteine cluster protein [Bryobacteraceae bacterium]|nr:YkgJ family cysteine cluster protein [Bryobacteraceae bacterium]HPT24774.1 YkgJ family cysteine cluster protein [Bryobacteraceae bacterium]
MSTGTAAFTLRLGKNEYKCDIKLPTGPVRVVELLPVMNAVAGLVVDNAVDEAVDEGRTVTCKAGCGACCRQPVPISVHEAEALLKLVAGMEWERRTKVEGRFAEAMRRMEESGLIEAMRGIGQLTDEVERRDLALKYFTLGVACPFLEEESCSIYEHRPMRCREYLVTSPAENCAKPTPESVKMVVLKGAPAQALYRLGSGEAEVAPEFIVMTLLPDWKGRAGEATVPAPQILQTFLISLGGGESKSEAKPE